MRPQNAFARYVIQSDTVGVPSVWRRGLRGEGEIVVVGDTGLDHDHCMFHDPERPIPFNKIDPLHRKVVLYKEAWDNSDGGDHRDGHGASRVFLSHVHL